MEHYKVEGGAPVKLGAEKLGCRRFWLRNMTIDTGISVNAGDAGKTLFVMISQHYDVGDATASEIGMLRCGYDGNHVTYTKITGSLPYPFSFSASTNGTLVAQAGAASTAICIISNRDDL